MRRFLVVVVLMGCGHREPRPAPITPVDDAPAAPADAATQLDAAVVADAGVADAVPDAAVSHGAPDASIPAPPHNLYRIIAFKVHGEGTILTVAGGAKKGIARSWRATMVDRRGKPVRDPTLAIVRVTDATTTVKSPLSHFEIDVAVLRVRIEP